MLSRLGGVAARARGLADAALAPGPAGRYFPVSPFRRLVTDLMHFAAGVPTATVERRMPLAALALARRGLAWSALFTRAYARVAAGVPCLRAAYLQFPRPLFYEHPVSVAAVNVERVVAGECVVLYALVPAPEALPLADIDAAVRLHKDAPVGSLASYRRADRLSRVPWPLRRPAWWAALNLSGAARARYFGTFGVSSVGSAGAGILSLTPLLTSQLHYGLIDRRGRVEVRLTFDHRVLDGATAARALTELEGVLLGEVARDCGEAGATPRAALPRAG